jgi:hypothetical protein
MVFHLDFAVNKHEYSAEFLFKSSIDALDHGAEIIETVTRVGHGDKFHSRDFLAVLGFCFVPPRNSDRSTELPERPASVAGFTMTTN